jgi:hypothetical protein
MPRPVRSAVAALALLTLVGIVTVTVSRLPAVGAAEQTGTGSSDPERWTIVAGVEVFRGPAASRTSPFRWRRVESLEGVDRFEPGTPTVRISSGVRFELYERTGGGAASTFVWIPVRTVRDLGFDARAHLRRILPAPVLGSAPAADRLVTNVSTWLWTDTAWQPVTVTARVPTPTGFVWTETTATPVSLRFDPGDGSLGTGPVVCEGPGTAWSPDVPDTADSSCSYTFTHSSSVAPNGSSFSGAVSIEWQVTWRGSNGQGGGLAPIVTTAPAGLVVGEIQAVVSGS